MQDTNQAIQQLTETVEKMAETIAQNEHRYQSLARIHRLTSVAFLVLAALIVYVSVNLIGAFPADAETDGTLAHLKQDVEKALSGGAHWVGKEMLRAEKDPKKVEEWVKNGWHRVEHWEHKKAKVMANALKNLDDKYEPFHAIVLFLGEIQAVLKAMPDMRDDMNVMRIAMSAMRDDMDIMRISMEQMNVKMSAMPSMATDMHTMNINVGAMTYGIDSTMGRMGRNMPGWMPW